jgi:hypothetical protein
MKKLLLIAASLLASLSAADADGVTYTLGRLTATDDWVEMPIMVHNDTPDVVSVWFRCKFFDRGQDIFASRFGDYMPGEPSQLLNILPGGVGYTNGVYFRHPSMPAADHAECSIRKMEHEHEASLLVAGFLHPATQTLTPAGPFHIVTQPAPFGGVAKWSHSH